MSTGKVGATKISLEAGGSDPTPATSGPPLDSGPVRTRRSGSEWRRGRTPTATAGVSSTLSSTLVRPQKNTAPTNDTAWYTQDTSPPTGPRRSSATVPANGRTGVSPPTRKSSVSYP